MCTHAQRIKNFGTSFLIITLSFLYNKDAAAQEPASRIIKDKSSGCGVWYKHHQQEDSIRWDGPCKNKLAEGKGILKGYVNGQQVSQYEGYMQAGRYHGQGMLYASPKNLEGNFSEGEPLFLNQECLAHLKKHVVSEADSSQIYLGDHNRPQLYYHALIPEGDIKGVVVLMPGTWETTEHLLSSMQVFCEKAYAQHLAVLAVSINQRLTLNYQIRQLMNTMFLDAIKRYALPKDKFVLGGWSMGGLFSLRYTEYAYEDASLTAVKPVAVFSCDGPCDLENLHALFAEKSKKFPERSEPRYGMAELEKYCGGSPQVNKASYDLYSCYTHSRSDAGNTRFLSKVPVRIYDDVDPVWWIQNRGVDMYDMNALDQTAMILWLKEHGNKDAEFINPFGKGYRLEGNRHPHSWSIVDPDDCLQWILKYL